MGPPMTAPALVVSLAATVDLSPLVAPVMDAAVAVASVVCAGAAAWIGRVAARWFGRDAAAKLQAHVDKIAGLAVTYAANKVEPMIGQVSKIELKNQLVAMGTGFLVSRLSDTMKKQKLDRAWAEDAILARLPADLKAWLAAPGPANAPPAVPPKP